MEMNRLREEDISKKEEERQKKLLGLQGVARGEPGAVVGWAGWVVWWLVTRRPLRRYVHKVNTS